MKKYSIILPAKNEAESLKLLLPSLLKEHSQAEIIVVNDGSTDNTLFICEENNIDVISHPYSLGNGAAIKVGARHATTEILVFMDADGQHQAKDVNRLLRKLEDGYDMVVGARNRESQASWYRGVANRIYNGLASYTTSQKIEDLTSGFRAARASKFKEFLYLLPNGFSYPTTSTMAFFRAGYTVAYIPLKTQKRIGTSHIHLFKDGIRFLLIIFKVGTLYSPLKIFLPMTVFFLSTGLSYYLYTYITVERFTNMSALMFTTGVLMFFMGLVSEQITALMYKPSYNMTTMPSENNQKIIKKTSKT